MKLYPNQVAFKVNQKLSIPQNCCCCLVELSFENRSSTVEFYSRDGGTHTEEYSMTIPICTDCEDHEMNKGKYGFVRPLLYVVMALIFWGLQALTKIKWEIFFIVFWVIAISSELYWKIKDIKYEKYLNQEGHAAWDDFWELKIKKVDLAIMTFKSEKYAELIRQSNVGNLVTFKKAKIKKK